MFASTPSSRGQQISISPVSSATCATFAAGIVVSSQVRIDTTRLGVAATTLARTVIQMIGFEDALAALPPAIQVVIQAFQQNLQAQHEETRRLINTRLDDLDGQVADINRRVVNSELLLATLSAEVASLKDAANSHLQETIEINTRTQRRLRGPGGRRRGRRA
ncbi:hypothetical protein PtA15_7A396 [Puccinia triticina]|uniref:Uncharacterized protein n=1 Tax=Puccinia triticina TaxID=208348 RepID=A0ABY7CQS1_9BASI|nr:uncharacterized protein PtA15_7A396 [Puccinia triticina]WAQ86668.1 hypothetical protein PtA15_7A396 [Puccinia triticina]